MLVARILSKTRPQNQCFYLLQNCVHHRLKSNKTKSQPPSEADKKPKPALGDMSSKYQVFRDEDSEVILDIYEDRSKYASPLNALEEDQEADPLEGLNLESTLSFNLFHLICVLFKGASMVFMI